MEKDNKIIILFLGQTMEYFMEISIDLKCL